MQISSDLNNLNNLNTPYIHRLIEKTLQEYLDFFSVLGLMGPRQAGKSSLLKKILPHYQYITFDDAIVRQRFYDDPKAFMTLYHNKVIFDEAQKVPEIFDWIKLAVDEDRNNPGKFVLCGSSQFLMMKSITESLAGRIGLISLLPFQYQEIPEALKKTAIYAGSYPELINKKFQMKEAWYAAYIDTYLSKDVRDFGQVSQIRAFQQLMSLLAANTAQQLNFSTYANDLGVDVRTIKNWISILEASFIIYLLPPYFTNVGKRLVKSPKIYFYDTGLVSFLTGIETEAQYDKGPMAGSIFENYLIMEIIKRERSLNTQAQFYYLRTSDGLEVDFMIDRKIYREWIEIKKSHTFTEKMMANIKFFLKEGDLGFVLYSGESLDYSPPCAVLNYEDYLKK